MQYQGDLYAKIGRKYLKLEMTSDDVDNMSKRIKELEEENAKLKYKDELKKTELLEKKLKKAKKIIKKSIYYIDTIDENGFHDKERCKFISEVEEFLKNEE